MTRRLILPLIFGLVGASILIGLGVWQIQRLTWKEAILAEIDARIADVPIPLRDALDPKVIEFQPVRVTGRFTGEELHVLASIKRVGAVYRIIAAFETDQGPRIMVDRGFVPTDQKDAPRKNGPATVIGNLRFPQERDSFTPAPDLEKNIWFIRDPQTMSEALNTDYVFVIQRSGSLSDPGVTPLPVASAGIPNDHLNYAITWFSLAAIWILMTGFLIYRLRSPGQKDN